MKLKHKILLLVIGILLVVSLLISSSYALWVFNVSQESTNAITSDCFEITFTYNNPIHLEYSFPMRDSDGVQTTPYTFTIKNICNHPADFQINLETLSTSTVDESFIKADLNGFVTEYNAAESVEPTITGAKSAAMLYEDTLEVNGKKTYNLRIWVNEIATQEDVENKSYASKVSVKTTVKKKYAVATLKKGLNVNLIFKSLAGDVDPAYNSSNTSIVSIERSLSAPEEEDNYQLISNDGSAFPIYAWFKNGTIYIYCEADKIYMNTDASFIFSYITNLTSLDLSYFDTSNATTMYCMFLKDSNLAQLDVSNFDTSKVTSMGGMFRDMNNLTSLDISNFNTSNVKNVYWMFMNLNKVTDLDLSHFDTSNVTDMSYMFYGMENLNSIDVSNFNTSKVTKMTSMFQHLKKITNLDVSNFNTSNVIDMSYMFNNLPNISILNLGNLDTSNVTNMINMFYNCKKLTNLDVSHFDTSNVTNMSGMFNGCSELLDLDVSKFNTSKAENISYMFYGLKKIQSLDLSSFDTSSVTDISRMFHSNTNIETIYISNKWNISSEVVGNAIFTNNTKLVGGSGTTFDSNHIDAEYARVDDPNNGKPGYFTLKTN